MSVHPAANEASLRHLARKLQEAELALAVTVGNLAWKDTVIAGLEERVETLESVLTLAQKRRLSAG